MRWLFFILFADPLAAETCPAVSDQSARAAELLEGLQAAGSERAAAPYAAHLWEIWLTAPDAKAQEMLNTGIARREAFDFAGADEAFNALTAYCPGYAEGYNQRAFSRFLQQDYDAALTDLDLALQRAPEHIGALSGKALTLMGLGRDIEAQKVLRAALVLNPWLSERSLLSGTEL